MLPKPLRSLLFLWQSEYRLIWHKGRSYLLLTTAIRLKRLNVCLKNFPLLFENFGHFLQYGGKRPLQRLLTDFQRKKCTVPTLVHRPLVKLLKIMRKRKTENKNPRPRKQKRKSQKIILYVANAIHKILLLQSFVWLAGKGSNK